MPASSARMARIEVLAGVAAFAFSVATWTVQLFAPVYYRVGIICPPSRCPPGPLSVVDLNVYGGLKNFVAYAPGVAVLILAFLFLAGVVALGTYLHGARHVGAARWLVWGASLLLALLLPLVASIMADLGNGHTIAPFQFGSSFDLHWDTLLLGLVLCVGLAVLACMAATEPRPEAKTAARARDDTGSEGATNRSTTPATSSPWASRAEILAGMALFDVAIINWAVALYAPLYEHDACYSCPPTSGRLSLVDAEGGLGQFVRDNPIVVRFILAFLILAGVVTLGTYLHAGRRAVIGRWLVWGGGVLLLFIVTAMAALPDQSAFTGNFRAYIDSRFGVMPAHALPYLDVLNIQPIAFPDLVDLIVGPGLCAGLAVITAVTACVADVRARREAW